MSKMYTSIIRGLKEAIDDVKGSNKLKRDTVDHNHSKTSKIAKNKPKK